MINTTFVLIYLAPVSLLYNYSFLYDLLFNHPETNIGVAEKVYSNFWSPHTLAFRKNSCNENFAKLPKKTSILESLIQVHLQTL